ncbi:MAG: hypothetical protein R3A44_01930 [Caldilineaceae bacterium]
MLAGTAVTVQLFVLRLCYSRKIFVMAFPRSGRSLLGGHVAAFAHLGRAAATHLRQLENGSEAGAGRTQPPRASALWLRSHYLFESRYCTPGAATKGQVEDGVGRARRNFMTPPLQVADYGELNVRTAGGVYSRRGATCGPPAQPIGDVAK